MWELLLIFFLAFFSSIRLFSLTVSSYFIVIFSSKKLFSEKYTKRSKLTIYLPSFWTIEKQNRVQSFSLMNMYVVQCTHTTHCIRIHIHIRIHPFAVQSIHQMKSRVVIRLISYKQQNIVDSVSDLRLGKAARKKKSLKKYLIIITIFRVFITFSIFLSARYSICLNYYNGALYSMATYTIYIFMSNASRLPRLLFDCNVKKISTILWFARVYKNVYNWNVTVFHNIRRFFTAAAAATATAVSAVQHKQAYINNICITPLNLNKL